jgi:hypothetical protein
MLTIHRLLVRPVLFLGVFSTCGAAEQSGTVNAPKGLWIIRVK